MKFSLLEISEIRIGLRLWEREGTGWVSSNPIWTDDGAPIIERLSQAEADESGNMYWLSFEGSSVSIYAPDGDIQAMARVFERDLLEIMAPETFRDSSEYHLIRQQELKIKICKHK